jgi:hypothetical protein
MQEFVENLKSILSQYFTSYKYREAIEKTRELLKFNEITEDQWNGIKSTILEKKFLDGEPFFLLAVSANLPLDEDSDEEAYKWFELFIRNVESSTEIIDY